MLSTVDPVLPSAGPVSSGASIRTRSRRWPPSSVMIANLILASLAVPVSASETTLLPYIPTTLLVPGLGSGPSTTATTTTNNTAYIFTPNDAGDSVDLLSLDLSTTLDASSVSTAAKTLTSGLPFLSSSGNTTTFTPTLASDGTIIVYAGDCTSDTSSAVWTYNTTSPGQASWKQHQVTSSSGTTGPHMLGGGIAFSEVIAPFLSVPEIYAYGGQCPNASANGTTWVDSADYSNAMVKLTPSSSSSSAYEAETMSLKAQPIAEAGFSLTQLLPSTSNISGTVTQGINSVVLGGHTELAFVNMSTAAVWSLPEGSWSFVSISGPSSSSSQSSSDTSELAKHQEDSAEVQSRSGHTAILNAAGTALVILGGWVGNTSQAAEPQLAVLEMDNNEYGQWAWTVPDQPLADGEGIYGHGAALLPGNVMMVAGGYSIPSSTSSSKLSRRDDIGIASAQLKTFLNLTSMTWTETYTNPSTTSSDSDHDRSSSPNITNLSLGLGLGLGIPLLLLPFVLLFCYRSRRRRHSVRDDTVRNLNSGAAFISSSEMLEAEHEHDSYPWGPQAAARWYSYTGGHDPYLRDGGTLGYENLRGQRGPQHPDLGGGPLPVDGPGTSRGAVKRKPAPRVAKGLYQPTGVDESRSLGVISPILEDEEDGLSMRGAMSPDKEMEGAEEDDPFVTPSDFPQGVAPGPNERSTILFVDPSPSPPTPSPTDERTQIIHAAPVIVPQHPEVQDWVSDLDASDAFITRRIQQQPTTMRNVGRASPVRRSSLRYFADGEMSPGGHARTNSNISESSRFSFAPNRADSLRVAAALNREPSSSKRGGTSHSDGSSGSNDSGESKDSSSYATAKSIPLLQREGPGLLQLGRPRAISDIHDVSDAAWYNEDPLAPGSPSKNKPPRRSWFGSLRRVFSGGASSGSGSASSRHTESPSQGESSDYDRLGLGSLGLGGVGLLQKRRQGRSAWDEQGAGGQGHGHGAGEGWDEEDWDIERAVEQRLVQVMFSVPKERLRIVNGEPDIISIEESVMVVDPDNNDHDDGEEAEDELSPIFDEGRPLKNKGKEKAEGKTTSADHEPPKTSDNVEQRRDEMRSQSENEKQDTGEQPEMETQPLLRLLEVPRQTESEASESPGRRSFSPGVPMTAEEVRYERPRTRVQEMIEHIEERSRSSSPAKE